MPGGRSRPFRLGDRSELLAQHLLSGIAFTTPVPRQEDVGLDFLCSLVTTYETANLLKAGPSFSVQVKSSTSPIEYRKPHELEWIRTQENPMFVCVADREAGAIDVYSTWNLLCAIENGWKGQTVPNCIRLCPGKSSTWDWRGVEDNDDGSQSVLLGRPIVRITHERIFDETIAQRIAQVMEAWIGFDRQNIVRCEAGLHWVLGPLSYETDKVPEKFGVMLYFNPQNLHRCADNLALSATSLWRVLRLPQLASQVSLSPWSEGIEHLRGLLGWAVNTMPNIGQFLTDLKSNCNNDI